jgi:crotonobetainyl-CoA:carnitine CoA-transferase CaiB-like acyl-CoA transferase
MTLPLAGLTVLDFSAVLSGPLAGLMLADQGADVIKVEGPEGDTTRLLGPIKGPLSAMYISANRGKRSITLDLKQPAAVAIAQALVARADVLIENMRPGVMDRLGLGPAAMMAANPGLVYLSITGHGADGPDAASRVYDTVVQARSGFAAANAHPATGEPMLLPAAVCDKLTALTAAQAVCSALVARGRDGRGRHVQVAMIDAAVAFQWPEAMYNHVFLDEPPPPVPEYAAGQKAWVTQDGFVVTNSPQQTEFAAMCRVLGCAELCDDPRFANTPARMRHGAQVRELLTPRFATWHTAPLIAALTAAGVPCGRVNRREDLMHDAQVLHNQVLVEVQQPGAGKVRLARGAARFDGRATPVGPAPRPGEHGPAVLREAGFSDAQIEAWLAQGVLRVPD